MEKSPEAFRTISEVADWLAVPTHVLRFWESRFSQVKPVKRAGGRRYYRPTDMALLAGIKKLLHDDGLTIRGVQKVLREQGVKHVAGLVPAPGGETIEAQAGPAPEVPQAVAPEQAVPPMPEAEAEPAVEEVDPDAALRRFPFIDEPEDAPESEAPGVEPASPEAVPFVAAVPDTDPDDTDADVAIPGALPSLALPGMAQRLAPHTATLQSIHDRACALRDRMAARSGAG